MRKGFVRKIWTVYMMLKHNHHVDLFDESYIAVLSRLLMSTPTRCALMNESFIRGTRLLVILNAIHVNILEIAS